MIGSAAASRVSPEDLAKQPKVTTLQPLNCFYLESIEDEHGSEQLVLDCDDNGCGLDVHVRDDVDQMFWFDASLSQEWGKIVNFRDGWDKTKPEYLTFDPTTHALKLTDNRQLAPDFWYEMRENTLMTKSKTGVIERVTATQLKKWADVVVKPQRDNLADTDKLGLWHIDYCYWEQKQNPENAPDKIPQSTMIKGFPENWHKTGNFDYEDSQYMKFLKEDPRCPYQDGHLFLYQKEDGHEDEDRDVHWKTWPSWTCSYAPHSVTDLDHGDVLSIDHANDWCWNVMGFEMNAGYKLLDSFRYHIWVKWTGQSQPSGGFWLRRRWTSTEWKSCPRNEWCEIDISVENFDDLNQEPFVTGYSTEAYFDVWGMWWRMSEVSWDPASIYGCAYNAAETLESLK